MTTTEIPREVDRFILYFDTPRRDVNVYALATSLIGLADAIREVNAAVNPGYSVEVVVEAFPDGSFQAVVRTVYQSTKNLFSNEAVKAIVYGVIATHIYEVAIRNETPPQIIVDDNNVVIKVGEDRVIVPREVYEAKQRLEKSERFTTAIDQVIRGGGSDAEVRGIGLKTTTDKERPPVFVARDRFAAFDSRGGGSGTRELIEIAVLEISRAILTRGKRRWEFYWRGIRISAPVLDEKFFKKFFAHEITIAPGDSLRVLLRIIQTADPDTGIFINKSYEVVEVIEHIPRVSQDRL